MQVLSRSADGFGKPSGLHKIARHKTLSRPLAPQFVLFISLLSSIKRCGSCRRIALLGDRRGCCLAGSLAAKPLEAAKWRHAHSSRCAPSCAARTTYHSSQHKEHGALPAVGPFLSFQEDTSYLLFCSLSPCLHLLPCLACLLARDVWYDDGPKANCRVRAECRPDIPEGYCVLGIALHGNLPDF